MDNGTQSDFRRDNHTGEDFRTLERLNHERAVFNIPAMILVGLLMFLGVIGNALVVYVYCRRFKKTSSNYFILTMATFDLISCVIGMPTEIYDLNNPYTFYSTVGCKVFRGCETFTVLGSAIVLVEIAFDRYFKICRPLMVVSLFKIKMLCVLALILAALLSIAPFNLFGTTRVSIPYGPDGTQPILGYDCSIAEEYKNSTFQTVFYITLATLFVLILLTLSALYLRIWLEIRWRRRLVIGDQISRNRLDEDAPDRKRTGIKYVPSVSEDESCEHSVINHVHHASITELHMYGSQKPLNATSSSTLDRRSKLGSLANYASRLKVTRTTVVLFAVTVAFVLSYLPAIAIMVVRSMVKDIETNQSDASRIVSKIFSNFFFINNAINPIIYSFLNLNFRRQVKKTIQKIFCCFTKSRKPAAKSDSDRSTRKEFLPKD